MNTDKLLAALKCVIDEADDYSLYIPEIADRLYLSDEESDIVRELAQATIKIFNNHLGVSNEL